MFDETAEQRFQIIVEMLKFDLSMYHASFLSLL